MSIDQQQSPSGEAGGYRTIARADRQVFLLTICHPQPDREACVYLQASHKASTHKFNDLASAFAFLTTHERDSDER